MDKSFLNEDQFLKSSFFGRYTTNFQETRRGPKDVATAGEPFFICVHGGNGSRGTLQTLRISRVARSISKVKFNFASLPSTKEAAR